MSVSSSTLINIAEGDLGQSETTGANRSPWLDRVQRLTSAAHGWSPDFLIGEPWCGTWGWYVGKRAGYTDEENPWHPSTWIMWSRARDNGTLTDTPVPGCAIVWNGIHTGLVVAVAGDVVHTIEGNSGNEVRRRVHPVKGAHRYIVPKVLIQGRAMETIWFLEDPAAKYEVKGPWAKEHYAVNAYEGLEPARKRRAQVLRTGKRYGRKWVLRIGEPRVRGPWLTRAHAKNAREKLQRSLGRTLRLYSETRPATRTHPGGSVTGLGDTQ